MSEVPGGERLLIAEILAKNADKSFVKRIIDRHKYPTLSNPDGSISTHSMATIEEDGRYYAFPTVLITTEKKLKRFPVLDAWENVKTTGNFIEFDTQDEADWFSKRYKLVWGEQ